MTRNIKRLNISGAALAFIALALALGHTSAHAQTPVSSYTVRGIAPVTGGNISDARARALNDAQQKVVMAALADQLSLEKMNINSATLHKLFISRPDVYVQRFKIISENTLPGFYQILIEACTEAELLRRDLESVGIQGPAQPKAQVLLMVAEAPSPDARFAGWWAASPAERILPFDVGEKMAALFRERGIEVVDRGSIALDPLRPPAGELFPGREAVLGAASRAGAATAVLARAVLKSTGSRYDGSLVQVQCDMSAEVLDARTREVVMQTATNALGVHIDHDTAAQDAIVKACTRLAEQIVDRTLVATGTTHSFSLRCTFASYRGEAAMHDFFNAVSAALPEIIRLNVHDTTEAHVRVADIVSSVDSAALMQQAAKTKPGGYSLIFGVVEDSVINVTVTPPAGSQR